MFSETRAAAEHGHIIRLLSPRKVADLADRVEGLAVDMRILAAGLDIDIGERPDEAVDGYKVAIEELRDAAQADLRVDVPDRWWR